MSVERLRPDEVQGDIEKQMRMLSSAVLTRFHRMVIKPAMVSIVKIRFLKGKGPNDEQWTSWAEETKYGGRWSKKYKTRPSGAKVTADKIRNLDTKDLVNSYKGKKVNHSGVVVGPTGKLNKIIAKKEEEHGNHFTGWDKDSIRIIKAEVTEFVNRMALGKFPQTSPRSRV